jgi:nitrite reductase/ring-hydroxylating ferredoxin subunit
MRGVEGLEDGEPASGAGGLRRRECAALALAGLLTPAFAMGAPRAPYIPLKTPVSVPLTAVAEAWVPALFSARFTKSNGIDTVAPGLAVRVPGSVGLCVVCLYCPHELCRVRYDNRQLACLCHGSRFDPAEGGKYLSGPARRDVWKFGYHIASGAIIVDGIEADIEGRLL